MKEILLKIFDSEIMYYVVIPISKSAVADWIMENYYNDRKFVEYCKEGKGKILETAEQLYQYNEEYRKSVDEERLYKGHADIRNMVKKIILEIYGIKVPENKMDDLSGNLASEMFDTVFSDIYAKIAWFCTKKNIDYEEETLSKAVKIRNALAHGDNVNISFSIGKLEFAK